MEPKTATQVMHMVNPFSPARPKCINNYETWRKGRMDTWSEFRVWEYSDGSATSEVKRGPFSEKEYFKLILEGNV